MAEGRAEMLGQGLKYMVHYIAKDGEMVNFTFKTDRSFRIYRKSNSANGYGIGEPFMCDMLEAAKKIGQKPTSKMAQHGGFNYYGIRRIKCMDTNEVKYFEG